MQSCRPRHIKVIRTFHHFRFEFSNLQHCVVSESRVFLINLTFEKKPCSKHQSDISKRSIECTTLNHKSRLHDIKVHTTPSHECIISLSNHKPLIMSSSSNPVNGQANGSGDGLNGQAQASVVPRDVRLLHLIFATQGIQNYQDHVPLQLMDFAHSK